MPPDDYSAAITGGLKLKGANPSSKISKHKKKKSKPPADAAGSKQENTNPQADTVDESDTQRKSAEELDYQQPPSNKESPIAISQHPTTTKTEAELRHEERRRKRLDQRLKREGTKTHKERVEELNRYLSNLSEHHDMPRIGPG